MSEGNFYTPDHTANCTALFKDKVDAFVLSFLVRQVASDDEVELYPNHSLSSMLTPQYRLKLGLVSSQTELDFYHP